MKKNHFYHFALLVLLSQFATSFVLAQTNQPIIAYVSIDGTKTGVFKGNAVTEGNEGKIECIGFRYSVAVPHDVSSGRSSGKRQQSPFVIIKNIDYSTPQLLQAAYNNETLKTVTIEFTKKSADGRQTIAYRVTLKNASISLISQYGGTASADNGVNLTNNGSLFEEVTFTFQDIQSDHLIGNTTAMDSWTKE
ncbi:MAG: type secretion system effector, Hcp1 family [Mucilaginibacter sp.]|nr:type secretion system effector, Hcp1 family [Mucilaginibacter sp.]